MEVRFITDSGATAGRLAAMSVLAFAAIIAPPTSAVAHADPKISDVDSQCWYHLTAPAAVTMTGGSHAVAAEISTTRCTGIAQSVRTTVCIARENENGVCRTKQGYQTSKTMTVGPPRGNVTATGRGCYRLRSDIELVCVPAGPVSTTL